MTTEKTKYKTLLKKIRDKTATKKEIKEFRELIQKWQKKTDKIKRLL